MNSSRRLVLGATPALLAAPVTLRAQGSGTPLTVSTALRLANWTPAWTAQRRGLFAKHGLRVEIAAAGSIAEPVAILNARRAQIALTGTGMSVNATVEGARMKVIGKLAGGIGLWFIHRPGLALNSLEDLRGKSIASLRFPSNTVSSPTYVLRSRANMDPAQAGIRFVEGPPGSIIPAVRDGRADCGCVFEWDASIAETQHGLTVSLPLAPILGPIAFSSAIVREDWLAQNRSQAQAFMNALAEAMKLIRDDPSVYEEVSRAEFEQVPAAAIARGAQRLLTAPGVVPREPMVTRQEWDAIVAHELGAGTMRQGLPFEQMVDNSLAEAAARAAGIA
jgi:NitT/TauT family transport system substrate-binding protein